MIDPCYTKKKIRSLVFFVLKNYFMIIIYGNVMSILINNVSFETLFPKLPIKNITITEQNVIKINDFCIISIIREILLVFLFICICILYKDNTTSIIKFANIVLLISGLCELAGLFFIIIKLVILMLIPHYSNELYMILYAITCFVNIFNIYILISTNCKLHKINKRIMETNVLEINTV